MRRSTLPLRLHQLEDRCTPANVTWDGGGGDLLWNNALNWSTNLIPNSGDSVTLAGASGNVVLSGIGRTVSSLNLNNELTVSGTSLKVNNNFTLASGRTLEAKLAGGSFSALGPTSIASGTIQANSGATVSLSGLAALTAPVGTTSTNLEADGTDSQISMPNLTSVTGSLTATNRFAATNNAVISMPLVSSIESGFSQLVGLDGGTIQAGALTKLNNLEMYANTSLALPFSQFTSLKHSTIYASGGSPNFSALTTLSDVTLYAFAGANVSMPNLTKVSASDASETNFQTLDAGTVLSLPNLTTIDPSLYTTRFRAFSGSQISIPSVTSITGTSVELRSEGTGSKLVASSLATFTAPAGKTSYLTSNLGALEVAPGLTSLDRVNLSLRNNVDFPVSQIQSYSHGDIGINVGGSVTFTGLTNLSHSWVVATGSSVSFPAVTSMAAPDRDVLFHAFNANSKVEFPNLTSLGGNANFTTFLRASFGGTLSMPQLTQITAGNANLQSFSSNSVLDLSSLTTIAVPSPAVGTVFVTTTGTLKTAASLSLDRVNLGFDDSGKFTFSSLSLGTGATASGGGTLKAAVTNAGILRPQSNSSNAGLLTIDGNYTQTSTGQLSIELGGTTTPTYDRLAVTGQANLGGVLGVALINGHLPGLGNAYQVVSFGSSTGQFFDYTGLSQGGLELQPSYGPAAVTLTAITPNGPTVTSMTPNGVAGGTVSSFDVTFSEPMSAGSFTNGDVSIAGPAGPYSATSISQLGPNSLRVFVTPLTSQGSYTITVGPNITDAAGNAMNQDGDGTFGESPADQFTNSLTITFPNLSVSNITGVPASANFGSTHNISWTVQNTGGGPASGTWTDRVWLSTDTTLDGGDVALGDTTVSVSIGAGGNYSTGKSIQLPTLPFRPDGIYYLIIQTNALGELIETNLGNNAMASTAITLANPPRVQSVTINDGSAQRSRINKLTVTFTEAVIIPLPLTQAFALTRTSGPGAPQVVPLTATQPSGSVIELGFVAGSEFVFDSLTDGNFTLSVLASKVSDGVQTLDGNSDGATLDDYTFSFYRKFGDGNGDTFVNQADFIAFRSAFGLPSFAFDFNNSGAVDQADFIEFRTRFNT